MKKTITSFVVLLSFLFCYGQEYKDVTLTSSVRLSVIDIKKMNSFIEEFINEKRIVPLEYNVSKTEIYLSLTMDKDDYSEFDKLIREQGFVTQENTESNYFREQIIPIDQEIELLKNEKSQYETLVSKTDSTKEEKYFSYMEKIISIDKEIAKNKLEKENILLENVRYNYSVTITEESTPGDLYDDSWINMPGIEYSYLKIEQPLNGVSPEVMHGTSLKYLFNTKKSYVILGLFKSYDTDTITETNQIYTFALGQDFYSRRFGRGQRKFFNLYTSFNAGVYVLSSETRKSSSWYVNPYIGLELFKNKHFLIDNKVGYFLPFQDNRYHRGLLYSASFNFVF